MQKSAEITEDSTVQLPLQRTLLPSVQMVSVYAQCHPADLCGEERGDRRFRATEQRQEERHGPSEESRGNMTSAVHFSLTLKSSLRWITQECSAETSLKPALRKIISQSGQQRSSAH